MLEVSFALNFFYKVATVQANVTIVRLLHWAKTAMQYIGWFPRLSMLVAPFNFGKNFNATKMDPFEFQVSAKSGTYSLQMSIIHFWLDFLPNYLETKVHDSFMSSCMEWIGNKIRNEN